MRKTKLAALALALIFACTGLALAQDAAQQANGIASDVKQAADTLQGLPEKAIDTAGQAVKDNLPPELAPVADVTTQLAKTLANIGDGKLISDAVGSAFDQFGGVMADLIGSNKELLGRVEQLEKDNAAKMIEIEHSKSNLQALDAKLTDTTAVLTELLESHKQQLAALEARIAKLEAERGTVPAPFKVVDGAGKALFTVAADGTVSIGTEGEAAIVMKAQPSGVAYVQVASGPKRVLMVADTSDGTHLHLNDGPDAAVELTASQGNNGFIRVQGGTSSAILNVDADNAASLNLQGDTAGLLLSSKPETLGLLAQKNGQNALSLGAIEGKGVALRLFNAAGQQVVSAGPNPAKGDAGIVAVGAGNQAAAFLASEADGNGLVQVFAADGTGAAAMVAAERAVVAYNAAGNAVATISKSDKSEGGTVVARDPAGDGIFAAGFASESGGGEACVWRAKRSNTFCLGLGLPGMGVGK